MTKLLAWAISAGVISMAMTLRWLAIASRSVDTVCAAAAKLNQRYACVPLAQSASGDIGCPAAASASGTLVTAASTSYPSRCQDADQYEPTWSNRTVVLSVGVRGSSTRKEFVSHGARNDARKLRNDVQLRRSFDICISDQSYRGEAR